MMDAKLFLIIRWDMKFIELVHQKLPVSLAHFYTCSLVQQTAEVFGKKHLIPPPSHLEKQGPDV